MRLPEASSVRVVLLDAGGVLVKPSFARVQEALASSGVVVSAERLAAAEPRAKHELDRDPPRGLAIASGKGVVTHNGRMIENLHVDNARRILAVADAIAARHS